MEIQLKGGRALNDSSYARIGYKNLLVTPSVADANATLIPNTWERWESASGTMLCTFDPATPAIMDFVGIAAHNLFTTGSTIKIETTQAIIGGESAYITQAVITPTSNSPIYVEFTAYKVERIRITITGGTNREVGVIYAGKSLIMQRGLFGGHNPINLSSMTEYRNAMSDSGQFLGRRIKRKSQQSSFAWANLTDEWYRENFQPFVTSAKTTPFFIQWRPDYQPTEIAFGYTTADISPSNQGGTTRMVSVNFTMRAHDE